jgi:hypothetical protein
MIVAIINQTTPVGVVVVEEFLEALDAATGVAIYVAGYTPPRDPADYLGFDTGWTEYNYPAALKVWAYSFTTSSLLQQFTTAAIQEQIVEQLLADPLTDLTVTTAIAGLTITTDIEGLIFADLTTVVADPTDTKYLRISYVYHSDTDTFSVEAYERTTGEYALYTPPEYLVRELGEWYVVANGSVLVEV